MVERNEIRALRPGEGVASGEDTAGTSEPRMPTPKAMMHCTQGEGVCFEDQAEGEHGYRSMHHPHGSCVVWDSGNGMARSVPYHGPPTWAHQDKGRPVSLPLSGDGQRRAIAEYRKLFAEIGVRSQKKVLVLSPPGAFWIIEIRPSIMRQENKCDMLLAATLS